MLANCIMRNHCHANRNSGAHWCICPFSKSILYAVTIRRLLGQHEIRAVCSEGNNELFPESGQKKPNRGDHTKGKMTPASKNSIL